MRGEFGKVFPLFPFPGQALKFLPYKIFKGDTSPQGHPRKFLTQVRFLIQFVEQKSVPGPNSDTPTGQQDEFQDAILFRKHQFPHL